MSYQEVPFSADDLRAIADQVDRFSDFLIQDGEYPKGDLTIYIAIQRPDTFDSQVIGHIVCEDGWLGFQPIEDR